MAEKTITLDMDTELNRQLKIWAIDHDCTIKAAVHNLLKKGMQD